MKDFVVAKGFIKVHIRYKNGKTHAIKYNNQIINSGRCFLANCLLEGGKPHIVNMLFGDGGVGENGPKEVNPNQNKMNGVVRLRKPVVSQIDPDSPNQVIFTTVLDFEEGNDYPINEMALEFNDEKLFNLSTFESLKKTNDMEITYCWFVIFI
jgi:hypothetical protein